MYCPHCGQNLPDGTRFCTSCGKPVSEASPSQGQTAARDPYFPQQTFVPPYTPEPAANPKGDARWPIVTGILLAAAFLLMLLGCLSYYSVLRAPTILLGNLPSLLLLIAGAVLYFLPTKRLPFLTAIPLGLGVLISLVTTIVNWVRIGSVFLSPLNILGLLVSIGCFVLYLLGTLKKPLPIAIPIVMLVLSGISFLIGLISSLLTFNGVPGGILVYNLLLRLSSAASSAGYILALFNLHKTNSVS